MATTRLRRSSPSRRTGLLVGLAALATSIMVAEPARSAFPGANGQVLSLGDLQWDPGGLLSVNPDGSMQYARHRTRPEGHAVSPDGTMIAYGMGGDIYLTSAEGSGRPKLLVGGEGFEGRPAYSPDGQRIAFVRTGGGHADPETFVVASDGSGQKQLTDNTTGDSAPAFSPDGARIAFIRAARDEAAPNDAQPRVLWTMDDEGGDERRILDAGHRGVYDFDFAPDGTRIGVTLSRGGSADVYLLNLADGALIPLLDAPDVNEQAPSFSPDGSMVAFQSSPNSFVKIFYVVQVADLTGRRLASLGSGEDPYWSTIPSTRRGRCANVRRAAGGFSRGTPYGDRLVGTRHAESLLAFEGADCVAAGRGADFVRAGPGPDVVLGGSGDDRLHGGSPPEKERPGRRDRLHGGDGDDHLFAESGSGAYHGGPGDDVIRSTNDIRDVVRCGRGRDIAIIDARDRPSGCERVRRVLD